MAGKDESADSKIQGEGDYEAARRYRDRTQKFVDSGRVETAARDAAPDDAQEEADMEAAEQEGLRHRKP
jgi:hypothetical protein